MFPLLFLFHTWNTSTGFLKNVQTADDTDERNSPSRVRTSCGLRSWEWGLEGDQVWIQSEQKALPVLKGCLWVMSQEGRENILAAMLRLVLNTDAALDTVLNSGITSEWSRFSYIRSLQWNRQTGKQAIMSQGNKCYNTSRLEMLLGQKRKKIISCAQRASLLFPFLSLSTKCMRTVTL